MRFGALHAPVQNVPTPGAPVPDPSKRTARSDSPLGEAYELPLRSVKSFAVKSELWIMCLQGQVWLTTPDGKDHVLTTGESLTYEGHGKVVIEALQRANLWVRTNDLH